jgi:hypothetical protein
VSQCESRHDFQGEHGITITAKFDGLGTALPWLNKLDLDLNEP